MKDVSVSHAATLTHARDVPRMNSVLHGVAAGVHYRRHHPVAAGAASFAHDTRTVRVTKEDDMSTQALPSRIGSIRVAEARPHQSPYR